MRKTCCFLLAAAAAFGALAAERIVFVGDSITGQSRNHPEGFARQLDDAYAATSQQGEAPEIVSLGGSGQTVESWKNVEVQSRSNQSTTLDVAGVYVGPNLDRHADRLAIMLGMNNVLSPSTSDTPDSLAAYKANFYELATNIVRRATPDHLYLASIPPCTEDPAGPKNLLIAKMNAKIRELAGELAADATCLALQPALSVHYVPVWENQTNLLARGRAIDPAFHVTGDMVHPSGIGHAGIAASFLAAFGHSDALAWHEANSVQPKMDAIAAANTPGISYVLRHAGAGGEAGLFAFSLRAFWVVRPGEAAPASVDFALSLPDGWTETAAAVADDLSATFAIEGPAELDPTRIRIVATPASGAERAATVSVPAPWRVSLPVSVPWSNASGNWAFNPASVACETETAIASSADFATVESANVSRTPEWIDYFPTVDYVGGASSASLDFSALSAYPIFGTSYALRHVYSQSATSARLKLGSSAFSATLHTTVWLNGREVLSTNSASATVSVFLDAGDNVLAVRSSHLTWQWQVEVALEPDNNAVPLRYGLQPLQAPGEGDAEDGAPRKTAVLPDGSVVYAFVSNGVFRAPCDGVADVFIVGGGGGGGGNYLETIEGGGQMASPGYDVRAGGGGGGGGVVYQTGIQIEAGVGYPVTVGAGGAQNQNGSSSTAFGFEALGGGHGGRKGLDASSGASGGGAGAMDKNDAFTDGAQAVIIIAGDQQGNAGGRGYSLAYNSWGYGGGGGGAGEAGGDATTATFGAGGAGVACPFLENSSGYGQGGNGGTCAGPNDPLQNNGLPGRDGYGQGGNGCNAFVHVSAGRGGAGGSGTVIVRFYPDVLDPADFPNVPHVISLGNGRIAYIYDTPGSGLFTPPAAGAIQVFVVGGGGGGGGCGIPREELPTDTGVYASGGYLTRGGGGGGGGAVVSNGTVVVEQRSYVITVGAGGAQNENGGSSHAFGLEAQGGGAGAWNNGAATEGANGGGGNYNHAAGALSTGDGFAGGDGIDPGGNTGYGGGGGGAGGAGADAVSGAGGAGGPGVVCPYLPGDTIYGAGGNGGVIGGQDSPLGRSAADSPAGTGRGGDGCNSWYHINAGAGGAGGCGCVIIVCDPGTAYFHDRVIREAEGGAKAILRDDGGRWVTHTFLEDGTFTAYEPMCVEALLVGGGGAGGNAMNVRGGGGGAGGVLILDRVFLLPGSHAVTIGQGGATASANGTDTVFGGSTAFGGGGGGSAWHGKGANGGSGGGGCGPYQENGDTVAGGQPLDPAQGNAGGYGFWNHSDTNGGAGGGGGAGGPGVNAAQASSGAGGDAIECDFLGSGHYYGAGGGGGGFWNGTGAKGGMGGDAEIGGHGGYYVSGTGDTAVFVDATDGLDGTGSGGGGAGGTANMNSSFGKGGSGIVVIRYRLRPNGTAIILR